MPWYIWLLIGLFGGGSAGLFFICLLHCAKQAEERAALLRGVGEWEIWSFRRPPKNTVSKRWVYDETRAGVRDSLYRLEKSNLPPMRGLYCWEPRVHIDHGYRYFCLMCNRQFGEVFEPLIFRQGEITGRGYARAVSGWKFK